MEKENIQELTQKPSTAEKKRVKYVFSKRNVLVWFILVIISLIKRLFNKSLLFANGSHIVTAYPGGGKTLLASHIINSVPDDEYFFLSNMAEFPGYSNCYTFNINEIFKDGEQIKSFPTIDYKGRKLYGIIFDEINLSFNRRMNRTSDYNDIFIGLIEFIVTHRHQDVPRVYFLGQKLELQDTQLQSLFKYQHDIYRCRRWARFKPYNLGEPLIWYPVKLKMMDRVKGIDDQFLDAGKTKIKISLDECKKYNTKYLGKTYQAKPQLKVKGNYEKSGG